MQLLLLLISLFFLQPIAEYWLHRFVHWIGLGYHASHHVGNSRGRYWQYEGDDLCRVLILVLALFEWYTAALALLKYEAMHTAAHRVPGLRYLHRHHFIHHRNAKVNFSFSAVWPDRLFGTLAE